MAGQLPSVQPRSPAAIEIVADKDGDGWNRRQWPTPVFVRYEELTGRSFRVFYDDNDPNKVLREERVPPGEAEQAPKDGLMGAGFAEAALSRLLA